MDRAAPYWKRPAQDPWRRFQSAALLVVTIVLVGWIGYRLLGLPWFDALYQTVITITTVGFTEVDLGLANQTSYRLFTLFLVVVGVGAVLYTISVFVDTLIEGTLNDAFRSRRMTNAVAKMEGHMIICGWGQVGHSVVDYCRRQGTDVVVIDRDPQEDYSELPLIVGDATSDSVLRAAGVERAPNDGPCPGPRCRQSVRLPLSPVYSQGSFHRGKDQRSEERDEVLPGRRQPGHQPS